MQVTTVGRVPEPRYVAVYVYSVFDRVADTDPCDSVTFVTGRPATGNHPVVLEVPTPDNQVYFMVRGGSVTVVAAESDHC